MVIIRKKKLQDKTHQSAGPWKYSRPVLGKVPLYFFLDFNRYKIIICVNKTSESSECYTVPIKYKLPWSKKDRWC